LTTHVTLSITVVIIPIVTITALANLGITQVRSQSPPG